MKGELKDIAKLLKEDLALKVRISWRENWKKITQVVYQYIVLATESHEGRIERCLRSLSVIAELRRNLMKGELKDLFNIPSMSSCTPRISWRENWKRSCSPLERAPAPRISWRENWKNLPGYYDSGGYGVRNLMKGELKELCDMGYDTQRSSRISWRENWKFHSKRGAALTLMDPWIFPKLSRPHLIAKV